MTREASIDHEYMPGAFVDNEDEVTAQADRAQKLDSSFEYEETLTPAESILECEVTEEIRYSGSRFVVHPVLGGVSVAQNTGTAPGSRRVSGSVVALTELAAQDYATGKRALLTGCGAPVVNLLQPEQRTLTY